MSDPLLKGTKIYCKVCQYSIKLDKSDKEGVLKDMEHHVKNHKAVMVGWSNPDVQKMQWRKLVGVTGIEPSVTLPQ